MFSFLWTKNRTECHHKLTDHTTTHEYNNILAETTEVVAPVVPANNVTMVGTQNYEVECAEYGEQTGDEYDMDVDVYTDPMSSTMHDRETLGK